MVSASKGLKTIVFETPIQSFDTDRMIYIYKIEVFQSE